MSIKASNIELLKDQTSYGIYCVNIFGSGLNSIKNEFKRQVRSGLRQTVFVIDLDDIQMVLNMKTTHELIENSNTDLINLIVQNIQEIRKDYEMLTKKVNEELKFDLYQYWLKHKGESKKAISDKPKNTKSPKESKQNKDLKEKYKISCASSLIAKEHNRQGQSTILGLRKYIKDEPILDKLYIIILGQMSKVLYTDLLSINQPLEGIINFIPTESNYDIMLGNNKLRNFIASTLEAINYSTYKFRQEVILKPVGLFTLELPVISNYLAAKHAREIFDQLTWSIYDIDILKQQYENYYFKPFQLIDVEIPASDNLTELYYVAETLNMKGQFQKSLLPAANSDLASIACYLNCLLNTCTLQENATESLSNNLSNSFSTITNISKYKRLVVAENNKLLLNMLQYADLDKYRSIYLCCLDYNIVGQYAISKPTIISTDGESRHLQMASSLTLPQYVKYYANKDCTCQRITELLDAYDEYEIHHISNGYKLYTFKRKYYVLNENQGSDIIPTRLCFRDFTLFQMKEFLKDLQTSKLYTSSNTDIHSNEKKRKTIEMDENIFVRPNSLKSLMLQEERRSEGNKSSRKSESRASKNKTEKKSSLSKSINDMKENQGLPPDHHHHLKGYNLGDTLQEVKYKTSKYYFHQGLVKLYEEKWCFQDMNKQLSLSINEATLFFSRPRHQLKGISNNFRLITKNNISIRIMNDAKESSKIVMNYPNGLSVAHYENCCEQIWYCEPTPQNEQRRKFTNLGAIIVFFKAQDMIQILRYNGEVYRLYQHELAEEGEEQDGISNFGDDEKKSTEFEDLISQGDSLLIHDQSQSDHLTKQRVQSKKTSNQYSVDVKRHPQQTSSEEKSYTETKSTTHNLISSINNELKFLNLLCSIYDLTYLHVVVTTSQGKRINLTHQGEIFEGHQCFINEWHDYFANEAYCERSDGVKMIWTQDSFKCFHKDGTVIITTMEDDIAATDDYDDDEFEFQISQSSSHNEFSEERGNNKSYVYQHELDQYLTVGKLISTFNSTYTITETAGEHKANDIPFMRYKCKSWLMQHQNYAKVYILNSKLQTLAPRMEIFGSNNIKIYTQLKENDKHNFEDFDYLRSESEEYMEDKANKKLLVNLWISESLHIKTDNESCNIYAIIQNSKSERKLKSESLSLSIKYTDYINDAFNYLVNKVASVECNPEQELEELYFIEKANTDGIIRGFEFFNSLPITSNYKLHVGNTITEIKSVSTINEPLICNCEEHKKDLKKFPRFKQKPQEKTCYSPANEFPRFLSANTFIEIPKQLLSLANVTKFLDPFENIHFKKLRTNFKNILSRYLEPQQQFHLKIFTSKKNWKKRQREHERRVFTENQRLGLYNAMNKHKIYPNYWKFTQSYGSEVRHIAFFDFMQNHCCKKHQGQNCNNYQFNK